MYKKTVTYRSSVIMKPNNAANADIASPYAQIAYNFLFITLCFSKKHIMRKRTMVCTKTHLQFVRKMFSLANQTMAWYDLTAGLL